MAARHRLEEPLWRARAACRGTDPTLFFPAGCTGVALEEIATAKAVCGGCRVRQECLEFALSTKQEAGIWGGMTEEERHRRLVQARALPVSE